MTVKALIFDFDGLILDTETPDFELTSELYRQHGSELLHEHWLQNLGTVGEFDLYDHLAKLTGHSLDLATVRTQQRARYLDRCEQQPLQPGVLDLLNAGKAAGLPIAVASSSDRAWVEGWLEKHCIRDYFQCVRTRDDVERVKPAPDLFLSAAACLDVAPKDCVVFEDSPNGMRAAAAAGIRCVAVPVSLLASLELPPVALRLKSLAELPPKELIARLDAVAPPAVIR